MTEHNPSGSRYNKLLLRFAAGVALSAVTLTGCSTSEAVSAQSGAEKSGTSTGSGPTSATKSESTPPKEQSSANAAESSADTTESERVPLRDWKGLEILDNLPSDPNEKTEKVFEFIMLNDPECDLTAEHIAANTTWGNFTDTGEQLMKALNVVGSLYSDPTVKGNQKKADMLIDGMTSYHSPEANKKLKVFIHDTFFAADFIDKHQPEVFNQRFNGTETTQNTNTLTAMFAEDGEPYQGYTISAKLQPAHNDLGLPGGLKEPTLHIDLNVGGVITKFEVE